MRYRGSLLSVTATEETTTYELLEGPPITLTHHGDQIRLDRESVARPNPPRPPSNGQPRQPPAASPPPDTPNPRGTNAGKRRSLAGRPRRDSPRTAHRRAYR
ncbi:glycosyl hydrolase family 65 protein [Nonomuraea ferruginea]